MTSWRTVFLYKPVVFHFHDFFREGIEHHEMGVQWRSLSSARGHPFDTRMSGMLVHVLFFHFFPQTLYVLPNERKHIPMDETATSGAFVLIVSHRVSTKWRSQTRNGLNEWMTS